MNDKYDMLSRRGMELVDKVVGRAMNKVMSEPITPNPISTTWLHTILSEMLLDYEVDKQDAFLSIDHHPKISQNWSA